MRIKHDQFEVLDANAAMDKFKATLTQIVTAPKRKAIRKAKERTPKPKVKRED